MSTYRTSAVLAIGQGIDSALKKHHKWIASGNKISISVSAHEHKTIDGLPSASWLGRCARKERFTRMEMTPTHPEDPTVLDYIFAQGIFMGQWVAHALMVYADFSNVKMEKFIETEFYTGTIDILATSAGIPFLVEVKHTGNIDVQRSYVLQTIAYLQATECAYGFIVMMGRATWQIFCVVRNHEADRWDVLSVPSLHVVQQVTAEEFDQAVKEHHEILNSPGLGSATFSLLSPDHSGNKMAVKVTVPECAYIFSQPLRYKTKRTTNGVTYNPGDVRPGHGKISCPFAGLCFGDMMDTTNFNIGLDWMADGFEMPTVIKQDDIPF